ncbi:MAG TPA: cytochrome c [Thiolinea sp.]|nr:cytochrome c [Thiolinea sp.]
MVLAVLLAGCGDHSSSTQQAAAESGAAAEQTAGDGSTALLDQHPGRVLHDANCISCHDTGAYSRVDRKIRDRDQLLAQVRRCDANLGTRLFDEDMEQVADYLNQAFYHF